jgi:hypothetical protein
LAPFEEDIPQTLDFLLGFLFLLLFLRLRAIFLLLVELVVLSEDSLILFFFLVKKFFQIENFIFELPKVDLERMDILLLFFQVFVDLLNSLY